MAGGSVDHITPGSSDQSIMLWLLACINSTFSVFDTMINLYAKLSTANMRADLQNYKNSLVENKPNSSLIRVGNLAHDPHTTKLNCEPMCELYYLALKNRQPTSPPNFLFSRRRRKNAG